MRQAPQSEYILGLFMWKLHNLNTFLYKCIQIVELLRIEAQNVFRLWSFLAERLEMYSDCGASSQRGLECIQVAKLVDKERVGGRLIERAGLSCMRRAAQSLVAIKQPREPRRVSGAEAQGAGPRMASSRLSSRANPRRVSGAARECGRAQKTHVNCAACPRRGVCRGACSIKAEAQGAGPRMASSRVSSRASPRRVVEAQGKGAFGFRV